MSARAPTLSVVVPVLNEEDGLEALQARLDAALAQVTGGWEVVYVDDGSTDRSVAMLEALARERDDVVLVRLSRNFGMEIAMSAGLDHARGERVALMHADLQDPPELIPQMLDTMEAQGADVVYTRRIGRDESVVKRALATGFYAMMQRLARVPYQGQAGDFRLMSRRVVEIVRAMPENQRFLRGLVAWVGFDQAPIEYRRAGRTSGRGASYPALMRLAFEALASFSDVPLKLASYAGATIVATSVVGIAAMLALAIPGSASPSPAVWALAAMLFLGGVQLICTGILGRYLARVHTQVLGRPLYVVARVVRREARPEAPRDESAPATSPAAVAR